MDIRLLAEVDEAFGQMSGLATCELLRRQHEVFGDERFERLAGISNSHVYNLRASKTYVTKRTVWTKTRAATVGIALRQAPDPQGKPGHLRVDTVHQGDRNGVKGLYLVNLVDEVTQYEYVGAVRGISERFLVPLLEAVVSLFPFAVAAFHTDNGSEYINHRVAALLNKLHIRKFTKSRARHSNDNALVEGKNAHVVRKWFGHGPHPAALRRHRQRVRAARTVAVPELPPPVPVRHRVPRPRQGAPQVPAAGREDALREAEVPPRRKEPPQGQHQLRRTGPDRLRHQRPRRRQASQRRPPGPVPRHRPRTAPCRLMARSWPIACRRAEALCCPSTV